jgi:hypothetical protein
MKKKTFIKVRRGLLDAKHVHKLGVRFAYYLLLLDMANWETGMVMFYRDKDVADQFEMPVRTVREWRRKLELDEYIVCHQKRNHQEIVINKWKNPRGKDAINPTPDSKEGYMNLSPKSSENLTPLQKSDIKGDMKGVLKHVTPTLYSEVTCHNKKDRLTKAKDKEFILSLETIVPNNALNPALWQLIKTAPKRLDGTCVQIIVEDDNLREELNTKAELIQKYKISKNKSILFFDSFEGVPNAE